MLVLEEKAVEHWCPHSRVPSLPGAGPVTANRDTDGDPIGMCLGTSCMAWRKHFDRITNIMADLETQRLEQLKASGWTIVASRQGMNGFGLSHDLVRETGFGYCGLAGKPEG